MLLLLCARDFIVVGRANPTDLHAFCIFTLLVYFAWSGVGLVFRSLPTPTLDIKTAFFPRPEIAAGMSTCSLIPACSDLRRLKPTR